MITVTIMYSFFVRKWPSQEYILFPGIFFHFPLRIWKIICFFQLSTYGAIKKPSFVDFRKSKFLLAELPLCTTQKMCHPPPPPRLHPSDFIEKITAENARLDDKPTTEWQNWPKLSKMSQKHIFSGLEQTKTFFDIVNSFSNT